MKTVITGLLLWLGCWSCSAYDIEVLKVPADPHWPEGKLTWRFVGKWPARTARAFRHCMTSHPEFEESECGVVTFTLKNERQKAWGLTHGFLGIVSFVTYTLDGQSIIISCGVTVNAQLLRSLRAKELSSRCEALVPTILRKGTSR